MNENDYKHIKKYRKKLKWSLRKAEEKSGVAFTYIGDLEKGKKRNPSVDILVKLAIAYGVDITELMMRPNKKGA